MNIRSILILFFGILLFNSAKAQDEDKSKIPPCGVREFGISNWLREFQTNPSAFSHLRGNNDILQVPMTIHIIGQADGSGYFSRPDLQIAICKLNNDFAQYNIKFFIQGPIRYHNNTTWYNHTTFPIGNAMYSATRVQNTMNVYIDNNAAGNCGYAPSGGGDRLFLRKSCIRGAVSTTWAHEMGHALSLPHTFSGWEDTTYDPSQPTPSVVFRGNNPVNVERVDRVNCASSADGFCDTEPDYLSGLWNCNGNGQSSTILKDPLNVEFRVDGSMIMSYANDACHSGFSPMQVAAMRANLQTVKSAMLFSGSLPQLGSLSTVGVSPMADEEVLHQNIRLEWESVPNAEEYIVEVSRFNDFGLKEFEALVTTNTVIVPELVAGRNYLYRVMPLNKSDFCTTFSPTTRFRAVIQTSTTEVAGNSFSIYPTLLKDTEYMSLSGRLSRSLDITFDVLDLQGRIISSTRKFLPAGTISESLFIGSLPKGMYMMRINSGEGITALKFMVP